jgi:hypothetical protein
MVLGKNRLMAAVRAQVLARFGELSARCADLHKNGRTTVEALLRIEIAAGEVRVTGISDVAVRRGAPIPDEAKACVEQLFAAPVLIPPPLPPPERMAMSNGRWPILGLISGDMVGIIGFGPGCLKPRDGG